MKMKTPASIWREDLFFRPRPSCIQLMKALANDKRLHTLRYLQANKRTTVVGLADYFSVSEDAISKHLRILLKAGLVLREQAGSYAKYELNKPIPRVAREALSYLSRER